MESQTGKTKVVLSMQAEDAKKLIFLWETNEDFRREMADLGVIIIQEHKDTENEES